MAFPSAEPLYKVRFVRFVGRANMLIPSYKTEEVFGISTDILEPSYVDRGDLDEEIQRYLKRNVHIALRGESKCGKSWLRKRNIPEAITVQCRLNRSISDLYIDALSQLDIKLTIENGSKGALKGTVEATGELGFGIFSKLGFKTSLASEGENSKKDKPAGKDISDLRFIAELINASGRRLVIEDFHYLSPTERKAFSFDLKALWDYGTYIVIIGIWPDNNLLLHLNPDLDDRVHEVSIYWSKDDLCAVVAQRSKALNIEFSPDLLIKLSENSFGTVGILQTLLSIMLDKLKIFETQKRTNRINDEDSFTDAAMFYADQLNAIYQTFASTVAKGIRNRTKSTGIYAHSLAVIVNASDESLSRGIHVDEIFKAASEREPRILKGNLKTVLAKIDKLQVDKDGRGLVITYDSNASTVSAVDKQLLLYRRYATVRWPWEEIIATSDAFSGDETED